MLTYREISAWIVSEGKPLDEYQVTVDTNTNKVSCWIPSEAGKHFSVHWKDVGSRFHSCAFISLDGFVVPVKFPCGSGVAGRENVQMRPAATRPLMFAEQAGTQRANGAAGAVALKVKRITIEGWRPSNNLQRLPSSEGSQSNVLSHRAGTGRERNTYGQHSRTWPLMPHDEPENRSYITFVFRYRPKEFLLSQGIMPADDALRVIPSGSSESTPSSRTNDNTESLVSVHRGSALQYRLGSGNVPVQSVTNVYTISTRRRDYHLGEGILQVDHKF